MVKNLHAMWKTQVHSLGQEDPLEKGMATHSSTLAWRISWTEEPRRLQSMGMQRVGYNGANNISYFNKGFPGGSAGKESICNAGNLGLIPGLGGSPGEGNSYPVQYSGIENSMDCIIHGATKSWTTQMVNTEIRLIIFFAAKDGETLYSQQKQDQELTVAQIMNSSLQNSDSN